MTTKQNNHLVGLLHISACEESAEGLAKLFKKTPEMKSAINSQDQSGWTPLHCAASVLHIKEVKFLLSKGADPSITNNEGSSVLHYLAKATNPKPEALFKEVLKDILKKGASVNQQNRNLETPLHIAAMKSCVTGCSVFLKDKNCQVNTINSLGETALHYAVRTGHKKIIQLLLDHSANPFIKGYKSGTPVQLAEEENQLEIIQLIKTSKVYLAKASEMKTQEPAKPTTTNIAFNIVRGKCTTSGCSCDEYVIHMNTGGGPCLNCNHYPANHENKGKVGAQSENTETPSLSNSNTSTPLTSSNTSSTLSTSAGNGSSVAISSSAETISSPKATPSTENPAPKEEKSGTEDFNFNYDWRIKDANELICEKELSEGTAAKVFKGKFRGQPVAIKVLKRAMDKIQFSDFQKEFAIYRELRSKHVVLFFGAVLKPEVCMVFEFCEKGSLGNVLASKEKLEWKRMLKLSIDVCKAVNVLHSWNPPIVHRDLKSLNLLVDENWTVKVTDFGLSRFTKGNESNVTTLGKLRGTYAYSAPELYFGETFTTKADVYSVGIILWEIAYRCITGEYIMPFSEFPEFVFDFQIIIQVAKNAKRPTIPPSCPPLFRAVIEKCWVQNQQDRPEIIIAEQDLQGCYNHYKENVEEWHKTIVIKDK